MTAGHGIDLTVPQSARLWNVFLGGKENFLIDQQVATEMAAVWPTVCRTVRECRLFLSRAVRALVAEYGVRQFLDIGAGIASPAFPGLHEIAQQAASGCRFVYADHDPLVMTLARAWLTPVTGGVCGYVQADLEAPDEILAGAAATLDPARPVALVLGNVLEHIEDQQHARAIVDYLMSELPSGSFLLISHLTADNADGEDVHEALDTYSDTGAFPLLQPRTLSQVAEFFRGLELLPTVEDITDMEIPGRPNDHHDALESLYFEGEPIGPYLVSPSTWRTQRTARVVCMPFGELPEVDAWAGAARKPGSANECYRRV